MGLEAVSAVRRFIEAHGLIPPGATVVVAVSGGIDSSVLLDVLRRLAKRARWRLVVAHLDHGLRGEASLEDARFVVSEARRRGLECRLERVDLAARVGKEKGGLAAVARAERYRFLAAAAADLARAQGGAAGRRIVPVATAHTASDQAETLVLRLLRGAGERGLGGIPIRRGLGPGIEVVRPLLGLVRADVEAHARRFDVRWREDASNKNLARARNRVRHEVMPVLARMQPDAEKVLARAATQAAAAAKVLRRLTRQSLSRSTVEEAEGTLVLSRVALLALSAERLPMVVRAGLARVRGESALSAAHVEATCALLRKGKGRAVLAGAEARATRDRLVLRAAHRPGFRDPAAE